MDARRRLGTSPGQSPRISPAFLEEERQALGPMRFAQEYECEFIDAETAVFGSDLIEAAFSNVEFEPFFPVS